jgi:hypothetical protein
MQHVSWLVVRRCGARRWWSTTRWRSRRDVPCRWTGSGEGRTSGLDRRTRRLGDQLWWLTSGDINKRKCTWEWLYWTSQDDGRASRAKALEDLVAGRSRMEVTSVKLWGTRIEYATHGGLVGWASKPPGNGFTGLALKPRRRFWGGTNGMWQHRGVRVEAKLSHEGHSGHQMKTTSG